MDETFINVNKTLTRDLNKKIIVGPPKTEKSINGGLYIFVS